MKEQPYNRRVVVYRNQPPRRRVPRWLMRLIASVIIAGVLLGVGLLWLKRRLTEHFDVLIVNGLVVDGTGAPARRAVIGIRDGKIAAVTWPTFAQADRLLDAEGMVVAPGLIDVHTHIEGNVAGASKGPLPAPNFISQGITTIITGNCGRSATSLAKFFRQLESQGVEINVASLVGHNTIRRQVLGEAGRAPTPDELRKMADLIARAMQDGALGLSTGLEYTPGTFADAREVQALATVAAQYHGIYTTHMRDEGNGVINSIKEALDVGRQAHIPVEISHLKWRGRINWGQAQRLIDLLRQAQREGLQVRCDLYPYTASSTSLDLLIPKGAREGGINKLRERLNNPTQHRRIVESILEQMSNEGWNDFTFARVAACDFAPEYDGLTIPEIAALMNSPTHVATGNSKNNNTALKPIGTEHTTQTNSTADAKSPPPESPPRPRPPAKRESQAPYLKPERQAETICRLAARGPVQMIYENMREDDVACILQFSDCMLGSDSGIRNGEGRPHPRGYGSAPRLLRLFAIDRHLFSLEEAVRRMTSLPAETFGFSNRGKLLEGYCADVVIFDPLAIRDAATYDHPFRAPEGIAYVLVNGQLAFDHGRSVALRAGQIIKREP
jgi:N-acyl-D-amino-acid deacylase